MITANVDYDHNDRLQTVLASLKGRAIVVGFEPAGRAGTRLTLGFKTTTDALAFLRERYPDDSEEFNRARIQR